MTGEDLSMTSNPNLAAAWERLFSHGREIGELKESDKEIRIKLDGHMKEMSKKLEELSVQMSGRPTWMVSNSITALTSIIVALMAIIMTGILK